MALGKRNNGNFRLSSVEVGAPRIWIHLNRIRKKQMEEKIGTGHSLHDVVSLQLFSSHLNQSEPHSNHVNRRKTRTHGAKPSPFGRGRRIDFSITRSCNRIASTVSCD